MQDVMLYGSSILLPVLILLAAIALLVRFGGSATGVLGSIGLFLIFLVQLFWGLLRLNVIDAHWIYDYEGRIYHDIFAIIVWFGWVLVVIALFAAQARRRGDAAPVHPAAGFGAPHPAAPHPAAHHPAAYPAATYDSGVRPGWGLVSTWIVFSSLAWVSGLIFFALFLDSGSRVSDREMREMAPFGIVWVLTIIPAVIIFYVWLYQTWKAVPPPHRSATPGQAVGFMFIPIFNYYWIFRAIPGLSASIGRANEAVTPGRASGAGFGVAVAACIIALIPYVGIVSWIFFLIWICMANAGKNRMLREQTALPPRDAYHGAYERDDRPAPTPPHDPPLQD